MPRPLRNEFEGAIWHPTGRPARGGSSLMHRGDRREPIFRDDVDGRRFLDTLVETCAKTAWQEAGEAKTERRAREEPAGQCWRETDLGRRGKSDPGKV